MKLPEIFSQHQRQVVASGAEFRDEFGGLGGGHGGRQGRGLAMRRKRADCRTESETFVALGVVISLF